MSWKPALLAVVAVVLGACKPKEDAFVSKYVEAECEFALTCYAPDVLEFYGWASAEECVADRGPEIVTDAQGCTYDKKLAAACLKAMKDLECPSDGDPTLPDDCAQVWTCTGGGDTDIEDTDGGEDTDGS